MNLVYSALLFLFSLTIYTADKVGNQYHYNSSSQSPHDSHSILQWAQQIIPNDHNVNTSPNTEPLDCYKEHNFIDTIKISNKWYNETRKKYIATFTTGGDYLCFAVPSKIILYNIIHTTNTTACGSYVSAEKEIIALKKCWVPHVLIVIYKTDKETSELTLKSKILTICPNGVSASDEINIPMNEYSEIHPTLPYVATTIHNENAIKIFDLLRKDCVYTIPITPDLTSLNNKPIHWHPTKGQFIILCDATSHEYTRLKIPTNYTLIQTNFSEKPIDLSLIQNDTMPFAIFADQPYDSIIYSGKNSVLMTIKDSQDHGKKILVRHQLRTNREQHLFNESSACFAFDSTSGAILNGDTIYIPKKSIRDGITYSQNFDTALNRYLQSLS